jgi:hypothetical protein
MIIIIVLLLMCNPLLPARMIFNSPKWPITEENDVPKRDNWANYQLYCILIILVYYELLDSNGLMLIITI